MLKVHVLDAFKNCGPLRGRIVSIYSSWACFEVHGKMSLVHFCQFRVLLLTFMINGHVNVHGKSLWCKFMS